MDSKTVLLPMEGTLVFTAEGSWLHDGEAVLHAGIADYFSKHLRYSETHRSWVVEDQGRAVSVVVEDTPIVVRTVTAPLGSSANLTAVLSGGEQEALDPSTLWVTSDGKWYALVRGRTVRARLLRPAVSHLVEHIEERDGKYFLRLNGSEVEIGHDGE